MENVDALNDFPFVFSEEATYKVTYLPGQSVQFLLRPLSLHKLDQFNFFFLKICENQETRCSFLSKRGIHRVGMWTSECSCGAQVSFDSQRSFSCKSVQIHDSANCI